MGLLALACSFVTSQALAYKTNPTVVDFTAPARNQWNWFQSTSFPMTCMDTSATGFGYYIPTNWNGNVMFWLDGGGFCYDNQSCNVNPPMSPATVLSVVASNQKPGPSQVPFVFRKKYAEADFITEHTDGFNLDANGAGWTTARLNRGVYDHVSPLNPLRDYMVVFVPYCTGDLHVGYRTDSSNAIPGRVPSQITFNGLGKSYSTFIAALQAAYANASTNHTPAKPANHLPFKVVLAGGSAGGFGADFLYSLMRTTLGTSANGGTQIITISDGGVPYSSGRSSNGVTWASGGQGYFGRPDFTAATVSSMEEWMGDAWGTTWASYNTTNIAQAPLGDGRTFYPALANESANWLNAANSTSPSFGDKFAIIDGTSDWMYAFFFPLYMNDDTMARRPNIADAQNSLVNTLTLSVFFPVSNTALGSGPLPFYKHHGFLEDDVSKWNAAGSNVTQFLSRLPL